MQAVCKQYLAGQRLHPREATLFTRVASVDITGPIATARTCHSPIRSGMHDIFRDEAKVLNWTNGAGHSALEFRSDPKMLVDRTFIS